MVNLAYMAYIDHRMSSGGSGGSLFPFLFGMRGNWENERRVNVTMAGIKIVAENRRARAEFAIEETYEAGIVLVGTEVKALREGKANLKESYADVRNGEAWLIGCHINPYEKGNINNHEATRPRKLLLHREEIKRLLGKTQERGFSLVPMKMYFSKGKAKMELGLGRGKKLYDRRHELKERVAKREVERALRERQK